MNSQILDGPEIRSNKKWLAPIGAIFAVYVAIRLFSNFTSWQTPSEDAGNTENKAAVDAGLTYSLLISDPVQTVQKDNQIQTMWRLIQADQWKLPNDIIIGDAPDLARELQTRAVSNYQARNLGQTAACVKILLRWSTLVLTSTGGNKTRIQPQLGATVAQVALDTLGSCPAVMQHPEIKRYMDELRIALENQAGSHFTRMLGSYLQPKAIEKEAKSDEKIAGWKFFANRDILEDFLRSYMSGAFGEKKSAKLTSAHLKTWVLICPLTWNLFAQSIQALEDQTKVDAGLLEQLKKLQATVVIQPVTPAPPAGIAPLPPSMQPVEPVLPQ